MENNSNIIQIQLSAFPSVRVGKASPKLPISADTPGTQMVAQGVDALAYLQESGLEIVYHRDDLFHVAQSEPQSRLIYS